MKETYLGLRSELRAMEDRLAEYARQWFDEHRDKGEWFKGIDIKGDRLLLIIQYEDHFDDYYDDPSYGYVRIQIPWPPEWRPPESRF